MQMIFSCIQKVVKSKNLLAFYRNFFRYCEWAKKHYEDIRFHPFMPFVEQWAL